jgi:hypothetical protein
LLSNHYTTKAMGTFRRFILLNIVILLTNYGYAQNLVNNPCFDINANNWNAVCPSGEGMKTRLAAGGASHSCTGCDDANAGHLRFITVSAGNCLRDPNLVFQGCGTYDMCMQAKTIAAFAGMTFKTRIRVGGINYDSPDFGPLTTNWETFAFQFNVTQGPLLADMGCDQMHFQIICLQGGGHYRFDDISVVFTGTPSNDKDCDGVPDNVDCNECARDITTSSANDADCDGVSTATDCDDNDPLVTTTNIGDADCDGVPTSTDCDDNDPLVTTTNVGDADCDGVATAIDCNDNDPLVTSTNVGDADCDGVVTAIDCDDNDPLTVMECQQPMIVTTTTQPMH